MKETFMRRWETRDLGEVTEFLRMRITREGRSIHLDQSAYLRVVLKRCGMQNAKSAVTPLPAGYVPNVEQGVVYSIYHRTSYSYLTLRRRGEGVGRA
jgi:hypothetical protein